MLCGGIVALIGILVDVTGVIILVVIMVPSIGRDVAIVIQVDEPNELCRRWCAKSPCSFTIDTIGIVFVGIGFLEVFIRCILIPRSDASVVMILPLPCAVPTFFHHLPIEEVSVDLRPAEMFRDDSRSFIGNLAKLWR